MEMRVYRDENGLPRVGIVNLRTSNLSWGNLTREERAEYMQLQMSPRWGSRSPFLPDDCTDCPICGQPVFGSGWCKQCNERYDELRTKLEEMLPYFIKEGK